MKYISTLALLCVLYNTEAQTCSTANSVTIKANVGTPAFKHLNLNSMGSFNSDTTQWEIIASAWTCNSLGFPECQARSLFYYDVSQIPSNATITNAKLLLFPHDNAHSGVIGSPMYGTANTTLLQKVTSSWALDGTGWANQPSTTTTNQKILPQSTTAMQNYEVNITDFIQDWVSNPATNYGMELRLQVEQYYNSMIFRSADAPDSLKPRVEITYTIPTVNQLIIKGQTGTPSFRHLNLNSMGSFNSDTTQWEIIASAWTCNSLGFPECQARSLIYYDLSSLPVNASITNAKLFLYPHDNAHSGVIGSPMYGSANTSLLQKVTSPWTLAGTGWANQPTTTTTNQKILPQSTSTMQNYEVNITDFVQDWVANPATNHGMELRLQAEQYYNSMIFRSGDAPDSLRPRLEICYSVTFPLLLKYFKGNINKGIVNLTWSTEDEQDLSQIILQKSTDGESFFNLQSYKPKNSSGENIYDKQDDELPEAGMVYYRLILVNKDGSKLHSKILAIPVSYKSDIKIFPNPATDFVQLQMSSEKSGRAQISIVDIAGKIVSNQYSVIKPGVNHLKLNNLQNLHGGIYFIRFIMNERISQHKLIIKN